MKTEFKIREEILGSFLLSATFEILDDQLVLLDGFGSYQDEKDSVPEVGKVTITISNAF